VVGIEKAWRDHLESVVADPGTCLNCLVTETRRLVDRQAKRLAAFLRCEMSPIDAADDMDEIEEPVIVARDCERHHAKREHGITEIVPADKLPLGRYRQSRSSVLRSDFLAILCLQGHV